MSLVKLKPIQTIHFALSLSVFIFASVVYYLLNFQKTEGIIPDQIENTRTILPMVIVISMSAAFFIRKKKLAYAREPRSLEKKMGRFQSAHIIEMAFYEFTGLFACVVSFLTGEADFLLVAVAFVGILLFKFPHRKYVSKSLGLRESEINRLH